MPNAVELANSVVTEYVTKEATKAGEKVKEKQCGEGCMCPSCIKMAVAEFNLWADWLDLNDEYPRYRIMTQGQDYKIVKEYE